MPKGSSKKRKEDSSQASHRILETIIAKTEADAPEPEEPVEITPEMRAAAAAFGRIGGRIGGRVRAEKLDPERRKAIAKKAAETRWRGR